MAEEKNEIKVVGKQQFRDSDMLRITIDIPQVKWLILQQELMSKSFGNIVEVREPEYKLLESSDSTNRLNIYA